jgi:competence protein ComEC
MSAPPDRSLLLRSAQPLLWPAAACAAGVALDRWLSPGVAAWGPLFLAAAGTVWAAGSLRWYGVSRVALLTAFAAAGAARHDVHWNHYPDDHVAAALPPGRTVSVIEGVVLAEPAVRRVEPAPMTPPQHCGTRTGVRLAAEKLIAAGRHTPVSGEVRLTIVDSDGRPPGFRAGDRIRLPAVLSRVTGPDNPGEADWAEILRRDRVLVRGFCETPEAVERLGAADTGAGSAAVRSVRRAVREPLATPAISDAQRKFLSALLVGDKHELDPDLLDDLALTGTTYFVVVSGQNVMLVVMFVHGLAAVLVGARRAVIPAAAMLALYLAAVDADPPIVRAGVAAAVLLAGLAVQRGPQFLNTLALAAMVVLWANPTDLFDAGCLLSFLCTAALVLLGPRIQSALFGDPAPDNPAAAAGHPVLARLGEGLSGVRHWPATWISLNLAAWVFAVPLTACLFHTVSLINPLVSIAANLPLCAAMVLGFLGLAAGVIWPAAGSLLLVAAAWCGDAFVGVVRLSAAWPDPHLTVLGVSAITAAAAYAVLFAWLARERLGLARRHVAAAMALVLAGHVVTSGRDAGRDAPLRLTVLSVGHGLCVAGETPAGSVWLYDAGTNRGEDLARRTIRPFLNHRCVGAIDALLLSHPDLDHFSGIPRLLKRTPVRAVMSSPYLEELSRNRPAAEELLRALASAGKPATGLTRGDVLPLGPVTRAQVLWPPAGLAAGDARLNPNDSSLVVKIRHGPHGILLTGDIGPAAQAVLRSDPEIAADVLLMPHHGSTTGDPEAFLRAVSPRVIIISADHRRSRRLEGILARLRPGTAVYHTAETGAVTLELGDGRLVVRGFASGPETVFDVRTARRE